ncbi:response regulator [Marinobacter sp. Arc7-DN-1]|nr:response regulator [Marinobacter sp. Arc7-DN-1]AXS82921.1 response regulator [Marinobacter sp. Arc7-DN-1]
MTMPNWRVLSVDDDADMHKDLERILSSRMNGQDFEFTSVTSFDEGLSLIGSHRFDLIFLDVHEDRHDPDPSENFEKEDQRGEELLDSLKSIRFVPVIFYTGFPSKVKHLESHVVKVVDKGAPPAEVRTAVSAILETGLPLLTRHIEEQSRAYIWDCLEEPLKNLPVDNISKDIALLAARNLANNLSQTSVKSLLGSDLDHITPLEMYLYPHRGDTCNPADIFKKKKDGTLWMVLTPACDFEQDNAENVLLARIYALPEHHLYKDWQAEAKTFKELPAAQKGRKSEARVSAAKNRVKNLVNNRYKARYRFLPGTFFLPDCVVDFQDLVHLPNSDSEKYEVVCSLDNPYREEYMQLFSNYYGRIGTPDYKKEYVWEKVEQSFVTD